MGVFAFLREDYVEAESKFLASLQSCHAKSTRNIEYLACRSPRWLKAEANPQAHSRLPRPHPAPPRRPSLTKALPQSSQPTGGTVRTFRRGFQDWERCALRSTAEAGGEAVDAARDVPGRRAST